VVDEVKRGALTSGGIKNTFGTDINCVYKHLADFPKNRTPSRVVILTDGFTGYPSPDLRQEWEDRKVDLYVGLVGECSEQWLKPLAKRLERLPKLH